MLSRISFHVLYGSPSVHTLCMFSHKGSRVFFMKRGVTIMVSELGYETVGSKDLTCEDWMVNTRTDADLSAAVQNALQTLLPQIHAEIREEFRTSSGPSDAGENPLPAAAGTEEEQAKNFQWGLHRSTLNHLICMSYTDVAQVANAARNY
nr:zinc finger, CCHC-type, retrotransposon Gag domain protein [Tanacetum cinerariifolium]